MEELTLRVNAGPRSQCYPASQTWMLRACSNQLCLSCALPKLGYPPGLPLQSGSPVLLQVLPSCTQRAARAEYSHLP